MRATAAQIHLLAAALAVEDKEEKKEPKRVNRNVLEELARKHDPNANVAWEESDGEQ